MIRSPYESTWPKVDPYPSKEPVQSSPAEAFCTMVTFLSSFGFIAILSYNRNIGVNPCQAHPSVLPEAASATVPKQMSVNPWRYLVQDRPFAPLHDVPFLRFLRPYSELESSRHKLGSRAHQ